MEPSQLVSPILSFLVLGFAICLLAARFWTKSDSSTKRVRVLFCATVASLGLCSGASGALTISTVFPGSQLLHKQKVSTVVEALIYVMQIQLGIVPILILSGKCRAHITLDSWLIRCSRHVLSFCLVVSLLTAAICSLMPLVLHHPRLPNLVTPIAWFINTLLTLIPIIIFVCYCRRYNSSWFTPTCFLWVGQLTAVTYTALDLLDNNIFPLVQCILLTLWTCLIMCALHLASLMPKQSHLDKTPSVRSVSWCSPMLPPSPSRDFFDHSDPFAASVPLPPPAHIRSRSNVSFASLRLICFDNFKRKLIGKKSSGSLQVCAKTKVPSADMEFTEEETVFILRAFDLLPKAPPGLPHI